jgi:hypothetical protein
MPAPQTGAFGATPGVSGDAASMIGRLLTTPRPGGLAGIQGNSAMQQAAGQGQPFQEGIAGVASKAEQFGVKVYKGKNLYNEWEFVYDYRQDVGMGGMPATPGSMGNMNPNQPGLTAGGGLSGAPATFQPIPGLGGGAPPSVSPPDGSDPRQSQFGGMSPPAQLPSTGPTLPDTMPQQTPVQDGTTTPQPAEGQPPFPGPGLTPPITQPDTTRPANRTYQLPRSRRGAPPNQ